MKEQLYKEDWTNALTALEGWKDHHGFGAVRTTSATFEGRVFGSFERALTICKELG